MTLQSPVANPREAFCTKGCYGSFYRKRCIVCEGPIERKAEHQKVCRKAKCRNALRASPELFDPPFSLFGAEASPDAGRSPKKLDFIGVGLRAKSGRAAPEGASELDRRLCRLVAGPELSPSAPIVPL